MIEKSIKIKEFTGGVKASIPLILGSVPLGLLFGTLAPISGLSPLATITMSLLVYAGSAQFIVLALIAANASLEIILLTTFVVNLRHVLYATALVNSIKHLPMWLRVILGFGLTDETFAVVSSRNCRLDDKTYAHWYFLGSIFILYIGWSGSTVVGLLLGNLFPDMSHWGLEFAMSVSFIGMVAPYLKSKPMCMAIICSGLSSIYFASLPNNLGLIVSALTGVAIGLIAAKFSKKEFAYV